MDPLLKGVFLSINSMALIFFGKVIWDHYKSGRMEKGEYLTMKEFKEHKEKCCVKGDYLTLQAFEKHKEQCCVTGLKRDFNLCQQESCTVQSNHASRLTIVEEKLRDGQIMFQTLNDKMDEKFDSFGEKFDRMNKSLAGIQATLKFAIGNKAGMADE